MITEAETELKYLRALIAKLRHLAPHVVVMAEQLVEKEARDHE